MKIKSKIESYVRKYDFIVKRYVFTLLLALVTPFIQARTPEKNSFTITKDTVWAQPQGISLKMDIYKPVSNKKKYPVIIIYHGGGWLINHKESMDSLATYFVTHADYVVCNVDYRLLGDNNNRTTISEIVEDALGAAIWIKENISKFQGDSSKITVTGDSAGGHLAAMVAICGNSLSAQNSEGETIHFNPTWFPPNETITNYCKKGAINVKAAILSYPALDLHKNCTLGFETAANPFWAFARQKPRGIFGDSISVIKYPQRYKAISPIYLIPQAEARPLPPQLCIVGSLDIVTPPASIKEYYKRCLRADQPITFWKYNGKPHAFLDAKKSVPLNINFTRDAPEAIDKMIIFLNRIFYPNSE